MNVLIVEDEVNSAEFLKQELAKLPQEINVINSIGSVHDAINFLKRAPSIDLILMDIQLNDGNSFEIFETLNLQVPIIFITAYDHFLIQALKLHSIDYLLKPIDTEHLAAAIRKFKSIENYFVSKNLKNLAYQVSSNKLQKIVIKKGLEYQTLLLADIVYFFVEQKIVFCVDKNNKKFITEWTNLGEAFSLLDDKIFFRANRKYIINADYIKSFKHIEFGKTSLDLMISPAEEIIISQENSIYFRNWIRGMYIK